MISRIRKWVEVNQVYCVGKDGKRRFKRGFGMLEMLLVLLVVGFGTIAALNRYNASVKSSNINTFTQNMTIMVGNIKSFFAQETSLEANAVTAQSLIAAGLVPLEMQTAGKNGLRSPWGQITLATASVQDGTDNALTFTIENLDSETCAKIAQSFVSQNYYSVTPNGGSEITVDSANKMGTITQACNADGNDLTVEVTPFYL